MLLLVVNYIVIYDFGSSATDVIHPSNPLHLIVCFELFGHALTLCHLFYEPKKHIFSLLVYIGKVSVQFAFCKQGRIKTFAVRLDIPQVPLSPNADFNLFFGGQCKVGLIIISLQSVADTRSFVCKMLFLCVVLL